MLRGRWLCVPMLVLAASGCAKFSLPERFARDATMFGPARMRIHPIFTQVKDWTGDGRPDGIEALIEFQDRFDDPTKASGSAVFELFEFRPYNADPRGERVTNPWTGSLVTVDEQRARWNRTLSTYSFRLPFEAAGENRTYVLAAAFDRAGSGPAGNREPGDRESENGAPSRFFDRIVIEPQRKEPTVAGDERGANSATRPAAP